jgi:hypothetical protein
MPTLTLRISASRLLCACALALFLYGSTSSALAWGKKSPAQLLQEKREQQAAQIPKTCDQFRQLLTRGAPIFPPNANPLLQPVKEYAVKVMIDDGRFVPIFGKPYDALSPEELYFLGREALPYCDHSSRPAPLDDVPYEARAVLFYMFDGYPKAIFNRWTETGRQAGQTLKASALQLTELPAEPASVAAMKAINDRATPELQWAPGRRADDYLAAYKVAETRILLVTEKAAAAKQVASASSPADLQKLVSSAKEIAASIGTTTDANLRAQRQAQLGELDERIRTLSGELAASELRDYQASPPIPSGGLATLVDANAREKALNDRYGTLLTSAEFQSFNSARADHRAQLYSSNSAALIAEVNRASNTVDIDGALAKYIVPSDLQSPALAPVRAAVAARTRVVAPFSDFPGGDYMDAIFSGNLDLVYAADLKYFEGFQRLAQATAQQITSIVGRDIIGNNFDSTNLSLITPVFTVYLMNYGQTSKACLRPGFHEFVVNRRLVATQETVFGKRIVEDYGTVGVDRYPVNKEFIAPFSEVVETTPDDNALGDFMVNDGKATRLYGGVRAMMSSIPCNDARIVRFEKNLLAFYTNREANRHKLLAAREQSIRGRDEQRSKIYKSCSEEVHELGIVAPFEYNFMTKCRDDHAGITPEDIARWQSGPGQIEAMRVILYGDPPRFNKSETFIRQQHCESLPRPQGGDGGLISMKCMLEYQPTEREKAQIQSLEQMRIRRGG